ncbi:hypothetical protein BKA81DRAFT_171049 [Phyllosticta paracitricarpa]
MRKRSQEASQPLAFSDPIQLEPQSEPHGPAQKRQLFTGRGKRCKKMFRRMVHKIRRKEPPGRTEDTTPGPSTPQNQVAPELTAPLSPVSESAEWRDQIEVQSRPEQGRLTQKDGNGSGGDTALAESRPKFQPKAAHEQ